MRLPGRRITACDAGGIARSRRLALLLPVLLLGSGLVACDSPADPPRESPPDPPLPSATPMAASSRDVPAGYRVETCPDLRRHGTGLAVRLAVPPDFPSTGLAGAGCSFSAAIDRAFSVTFEAPATLAVLKRESVDPYVGDGGDDGIDEGVTYDDDARVLGGHRGEELRFSPYNDGLPIDVHVVQVGRLRLSWTVPRGKDEKYAEEYAAVAASVAVVRSRRTTCTPAVSYVPAVPQTQSIDGYDGSCRAYFRPGASLERFSLVQVDPRRTLAERAEEQRSRRNVSGVRLERDAVRLAGTPADRLTWTITREAGSRGPGGTWRIVVVATDDLSVAWGASPEQWRHEHDDHRAWLATFRVSPGRP